MGTILGNKLEERRAIALKVYNAKWVGLESLKTRNLYNEATKGKTSQYGVSLQNTVLFRLGYEGVKPLKRLSPKAKSFVDWMTNGKPHIEEEATKIIDTKIMNGSLHPIEATGKQSIFYYMMGVIAYMREQGETSISLANLEDKLLEALKY